MKTNQHVSRDARYGRRRLLARGGAFAAGAVAATVGVASASAAPDWKANRFSRMFQLPPFAVASPQLVAALKELGRPGGLLDARDALERGPTALIVDPMLSVNNPNNPTLSAGITFLGQFIDHDLTFDTGSPLAVPTPPSQVLNGRTPALDLDSVYGAGPVGSPQLYDLANPAKFNIGFGGLFEDLPRTSSGAAMLGDRRNDEHVILSGLHAAFLRFHNRLVDTALATGSTDVAAFASARRLATWHYQWIVLHEYLPHVVGQPLVDDVLRHGGRYFRPWPRPAVPVEFQGAAFRFGHSQIRPSYRANLAGDRGQPFFGLIFDPTQAGKADPNDMRGGCRKPRRFVGWQTFFDFGDGEVKPSKRIDTTLSTPLFALPTGTISQTGGPTALAQRTLLRHLTWELPSGQRIARQMGAPLLSALDLDELTGLGQELNRSTPLWYYILKEAQLMQDGLRLGPVGGRIVAEVIIGLLKGDHDSYLAAEPTWRPTLPASGGPGTFRMVDLFTVAGVDPDSRGQ